MVIAFLFLFSGRWSANNADGATTGKLDKQNINAMSANSPHVRHKSSQGSSTGTAVGFQTFFPLMFSRRNVRKLLFLEMKRPPPVSASAPRRSPSPSDTQRRGHRQQGRPAPPMFGCVFSLSLKSCLTVAIYDNRPLIAYRNNRTVTRRAESRSLLLPFFFFIFRPELGSPFLCLPTHEKKKKKEGDRRPAAGRARRGLRGWWSRAREACQMVQKLMTEKRKRQIKNFLY